MSLYSQACEYEKVVAIVLTAIETASIILEAGC